MTFPPSLNAPCVVVTVNTDGTVLLERGRTQGYTVGLETDGSTRSRIVVILDNGGTRHVEADRCMDADPRYGLYDLANVLRSILEPSPAADGPADAPS